MFERVNERAGTGATLHSLRHTAAYRMAEDPALPLSDVQLVLGHARLTTTQIYLTPRKEDVIRRVLAHHAQQTRQAAERARAWRPVTGPRRWMCCSGTAHGDRRHPAAGRCAAGGTDSARSDARAFPRGPCLTAGPPPCRPRDTAWERLTRPPFVLEDAKRQQRRVRGLALLLDWLAAQPGQTWQERWLASGADRAGAGWRQLPAAWLHDLRPAPRGAAGRVVRGADRGDLRQPGPSLSWAGWYPPMPGGTAPWSAAWPGPVTAKDSGGCRRCATTIPASPPRPDDRPCTARR